MATSKLLMAGAVLAVLLPACAKKPAAPVTAVGKVGSGLSAYTADVPQGAVLCAYQHAIDDPRGKQRTPFAEACEEQLRSDELWRRAMGVVAAYGQNIGEMASGTDPATSGRLEAAMSGVQGPEWIEVGGDEKAARNAVAKIVEQLRARNDKTDLEEAIKIAAPHVKTICTGVTAYLERQKRDAAKLHGEVEKGRTSPTTRRCAMLDNRSICVSDSLSDGLGYANTLGHLSMLEMRHAEAQRSMKAFCAAHAKLAGAAEQGKADDEETYQSIVDAVGTAK